MVQVVPLHLDAVIIIKYWSKNKRGFKMHSQTFAQNILLFALVIVIALLKYCWIALNIPLLFPRTMKNVTYCSPSFHDFDS